MIISVLSEIIIAYNKESKKEESSSFELNELAKRVTEQSTLKSVRANQTIAEMFGFVEKQMGSLKVSSKVRLLNWISENAPSADYSWIKELDNFFVAIQDQEQRSNDIDLFESKGEPKKLIIMEKSTNEDEDEVVADDTTKALISLMRILIRLL